MFWKKKDEPKAATQPEAAAKPSASASVAESAAGAAPSAARPVERDATAASSTSAAGAQPQTTQQAVSSALAVSIGKVVCVMMFSPRHQGMSIRDLATSVLPAVAANQFVVAEARQKQSGSDQEATAPVGLLLWARVSDEVDRRFSADATQPTQLSAAEWTSGDNYWVIESVGAPKVVEAMLKELLEGPLGGRPVKFRMTTADGRHSIQTLNQRAA